jgi:hypothetical protein
MDVHDVKWIQLVVEFRLKKGAVFLIGAAYQEVIF